MVRWRLACAGLLCGGLSACQSGAPSPDLALAAARSPVTVIASIGTAAQKCWFQSGEAAFRTFKMANEINSYAGRPRLLLVPKNNPGGLPSLVIQAEPATKGSKARSTVQAFGPLLATNNGRRIASDVKRWAGGNGACKA